MKLDEIVWGPRLTAAGIHLLVCALVAILAALLVFFVWFPYPYDEISGGTQLFLLLLGVDLLLGPALTLTVFDGRKAPAVLRKDLLVIVSVQVIALAYGLWSMIEARPVYLVFEYNRFQVVHVVEVKKSMAQAPEQFRQLPLLGPQLLSLRPFTDNQEQMDKTFIAFKDGSVSFQPDLWQSYDKSRADVLKAGHPLKELKAKFPDQASMLERVISQTQLTPDNVLWLPMIGRQTYWTVLLNAKNAEIVAIVPLDSF